MSTRAKQLTKDIVQPVKGVGCKLDTDTYHGIATGLVAGRTVADLSESYGVSPSTVSVCATGILNPSLTIRGVWL